MNAAVTNGGWWRWSSVGQRLPVDTGKAEADGEYLHEDAVEAVRDWVGELAEWFDNAAGVTPTFDTAMLLLAGEYDDLPDWSCESELVEMAEAIRARIGGIYGAAWGRRPSGGELERLLSMVAAAPEFRWLC